MKQHGARYLVALVKGQFAGYAGSIDDDIRVCTHPDFQGRSVGKSLIQAINRRFPEARARVKLDNAASQSLFESCGFVRTGIEDGLIHYQPCPKHHAADIS